MAGNPRAPAPSRTPQHRFDLRLVARLVANSIVRRPSAAGLEEVRDARPGLGARLEDHHEGLHVLGELRVKLRARSPAHSLFIEGRASAPMGSFAARMPAPAPARPPGCRARRTGDPARRHLALQGLERGMAIGAARVKEDVDCRTPFGLAGPSSTAASFARWAAEHLAGHRWVLDALSRGCRSLRRRLRCRTRDGAGRPGQRGREGAGASLAPERELGPAGPARCGERACRPFLRRDRLRQREQSPCVVGREGRGWRRGCVGRRAGRRADRLGFEAKREGRPVMAGTDATEPRSAPAQASDAPHPPKLSAVRCAPVPQSPVLCPRARLIARAEVSPVNGILATVPARSRPTSGQKVHPLLGFGYGLPAPM